MNFVRRWWQRLHWFDQMGFMMLPIAIGVIAINFVPFPKHEFKDFLDGHFEISHPTFGDWKERPVRCISGLEYGFEGIVFEFAEHSRISHIQVMTADPHAKRVRVFFADGVAPPLDAAQRDCNVIGGTTSSTAFKYGDGWHYQLAGNTRVWCPTIGLQGRAAYRGCMPF